MTSDEPPHATLNRARSVRLLILDVDGVLTDGRLYYGQDGAEFKAFHVQDGSAIKRILAADIAVAIISGRKSEAVRLRAAELGIPYLYAGVEDKAAALEALCRAAATDAQSMAHVGDDVADLALFERVGMAFAVPDAHPAVLARADHVTQAAGGRGAVREVCDLLLTAQGKWNRAGSVR